MYFATQPCQRQPHYSRLLHSVKHHDIQTCRRDTVVDYDPLFSIFRIFLSCSACPSIRSSICPILCCSVASAAPPCLHEPSEYSSCILFCSAKCKYRGYLLQLQNLRLTCEQLSDRSLQLRQWTHTKSSYYQSDQQMSQANSPWLSDLVST